MSKTIAVLKWLWACPLRAAILLGFPTYLGLRTVAWKDEGAQAVMPVFFGIMVGIIGYYWQSALEKEKEKKP